MKTHRATISPNFKEIKNQFGYSTNIINKKELKRNRTHINLVKRPKLPKSKHKTLEKTNLGNILDQIGNDDLIFNNDKLLTNIKIESLEKQIKKNSIISMDNDKSFASKKTNKINSTSINRKNNKEGNSPSKLNQLELNCNKLTYINGNHKKKLNNNNNIKNTKKNKSVNKNKKLNVKNVDQFINKPNERRRISNKSNLMAAINNKNTVKLLKNKKLLKTNELHFSQTSFSHLNNNDSISIASTTRLDISRGKSMPSMRQNKNQSNLRLPNKSIIKNQDKVMGELQKLFGEKIQLNEDIYQNMTDLDKKNCINFLLETIKELNNISNINKTKTDGRKNKSIN